MASVEGENGAELTLQSAAVLACMVDLLHRSIPDVRAQYSAEAIMLAMLTFSGQLARELVIRGLRTPDYVIRRAEEFRDLALSTADVPPARTTTG